MRIMPSFLLADASDLEQWSARRESQGDLPKLVRALIRASTPTATAMDFPAGDDIIYSGWDGVLDLPTAQEYLPEGPSVWEFGTNQEVTDKATADFKKRTANPLGKVLADTTYVFVTSRRWPGKEKWLSRRTPAGWKEIRVLDASDLEQWMEKQPAVHMWFSKLIGKHITGAATLQSVAEAYLNSPEPALPLALYRAGRDEAVGRVTDRKSVV